MRDIERTIFMRSPRKIDQGDFEVLYFLNLFGVKYILNNELKYADTMKDKLELEKINIVNDEENSNPELKKKYDDIIKKIELETETTHELYESNE